MFPRVYNYVQSLRYIVKKGYFALKWYIVSRLQYAKTAVWGWPRITARECDIKYCVDEKHNAVLVNPFSKHEIYNFSQFYLGPLF